MGVGASFQPPRTGSLSFHRVLPWLMGTTALAGFALASGYFRDAVRNGPAVSWVTLIGIVAIAVSVGVQLRLLYSGSHALALALASVAISWLAEAVGMRWGIVFGGIYEFAGVVGPQLPGRVPFVVPLAWFGLSAFVLVLGSFCGRPPLGRSWPQIARGAAWSAGCLVVLDLLVDPVATGLGGWRWTRAGAYYGVPPLNFAGWLLVGFCIFAVFGGLTRGLPVRPPSLEWDRHLRMAVGWGLFLLVPIAGMAIYLGRAGAVLLFLAAGIGMAGPLMAERRRRSSRIGLHSLPERGGG